MAGWVAQLPQILGAKCVESAMALAKGDTTASKVECGFVMVTPKNLGDPNIQELLKE